MRYHYDIMIFFVIYQIHNFISCSKNNVLHIVYDVSGVFPRVLIV